MMTQPPIGLSETLAQLTASYVLAERRLAEKMTPARLARLNFTQRNCLAASNAVIYGIRRETETHTQAACV